MEEDTKHLLVPAGSDESDYGIMNIQFNPEDFKCKRYEKRLNQQNDYTAMGCLIFAFSNRILQRHRTNL